MPCRISTCGAWKGLLLAALGGCIESSLVRAQFTETAGTVAPGTWFFESDILNAGWNSTEDGARSRFVAAGYLQVTRGLGEGIDAQLGVQTYQRDSLDEPGPDGSRIRDVHWGDVSLRSKWTVLVSEGGWNVSILPFVTLPVDRGNAGHRFAQFGLIVPFSRSLAGDWWIDAQLQLDGSKWDGVSREWTWLASANLQRAWNDRWSGYLELISDFADGASEAAICGGAGITRSVGRGGWDIALYRGITGEAVDWEVAVRLYWEI